MQCLSIPRLTVLILCGLLVCGKTHADDNKRSFQRRLSEAIGNREIFYMPWNAVMPTLEPVPEAVRLSRKIQPEPFVAVFNLYLDMRTSRLILVEAEYAPSQDVAKILRAEIGKWRFKKSAANSGDVLRVPVVMYGRVENADSLIVEAAD